MRAKSRKRRRSEISQNDQAWDLVKAIRHISSLVGMSSNDNLVSLLDQSLSNHSTLSFSMMINVQEKLCQCLVKLSNEIVGIDQLPEEILAKIVVPDFSKRFQTYLNVCKRWRTVLGLFS